MAQVPGELAPYIDHTVLGAEATEDDVLRACDEAREHGFAAVCVRPIHLRAAARRLAGSTVRPVTVIAFPEGTATTEAKVAEARDAIRDGAEEIDMVADWRALKAGDSSRLESEVRAVVDAARPVPVKVILETGALTRDEKMIGSARAKAAGASFVKTSTGFGPGGATVEDVALLRSVVGREMGVKASGGIRTAEDARRMLAAGANRLGTSAGVAIVRGHDTSGGRY